MNMTPNKVGNSSKYERKHASSKDQIQQNIQDLQRAEEDYCQYLCPIFVQKTPSQEAHLWEGQKADKVLRQARCAEL